MALTRAPLTAAFQALPLRKRLSLLIALGAALTALLAMVAVAGTGWWLQAGRAHEETTEVARTLAFALEAPVAFDDAKGISDALALLRARPQVSAAWVYDSAGKLVGRYGAAGAQPPEASAGGFAAGFLLASDNISNDGRAIGRVVVVNQLWRLWQALVVAIVAITLCSLAGFAVSVLLAQHLARAITQPITTLARASRDIATSHDYAIRLPEAGGDEVGAAVTAFNQMLDEIHRRGDALLAANRDLEARVTERTLALQREKERAEAASHAKSRFLANMSHELRTPLNAVIGAAQLLQGASEHAAPQPHLLEAIRGSGLNLLGLIDNILDLSCIETGALELMPEHFNLLDCVESAVATASVTARSQGLAMACVVSPKLALWRHGDPQRLHQVLLNLLGNAVKFTPAGEVVLRVERGSTDDRVRISVSDTGIGIGEASLSQIFEPFRQADDRSNRRFGGSGLGLTISRQLVEAMAGRLSVRSRLGEGSTFEVELPLPLSAVAVAATPPVAKSVLYFEPHEASAQALGSLLQRIGCESMRCQTPSDLRDWLRHHAADAEPAWLLVALDAPQSTELLEASVRWVAPKRVIGMSSNESHAADVMREQFQVPRHVVKPVRLSALVSRLGASDPAARSGQDDPDHNSPRSTHSPMHVLVVEDDPINQTIVCAMLANAGYPSSVASGGAQAIGLLKQQQFDLVLMDWQMPDMDGLEVTRRLRAGAAGPRGTTVPIIALTANAFVEDRAACLAAGMNDFLTKPVLAAMLETTVARWARETVQRS